MKALITDKFEDKANALLAKLGIPLKCAWVPDELIVRTNTHGEIEGHHPHL